MNHRAIATAVLLLCFGAAIPLCAQNEHEQKGEEQHPEHQAQPQQHQPSRNEHAQPSHNQNEHAQPSRNQNTPPPQAGRRQPTQNQHVQPSRSQNVPAERGHAQGTQQRPYESHGHERTPPPSRGNTGSHYGRISDSNYRSHFGREHPFHSIHPEREGGYYRFTYGGYNFRYTSPWPAGWGYNDDLYIAYVNGNYLLYDLDHPGVYITLSLY